ncbi:MAG: PfkB family carbohydrate kinase [Acetobacteraceae bacterium]
MRAIVIGNAALDETFPLAALPRAGETVLTGEPTLSPGGKGANQAVILARAGLSVRLVARIGADREGACLRARLAVERLADGLIEGPERTDRSLILLDRAGENCIVSTASAARALTASEAEGAINGITAPALVLLQGNLTVETTKAALQRARARGFVTVFNPAPVAQEFASLLPYATLVVANAREAEVLTGCTDEAAARSLVAAGAECAALTLGPQGALFADATHVTTTPALPAPCVDATGAGDTFTAVLAAARFARGLAWPAALSAATAAAAITIGKRGTFTAFPTARELARIFDRALTPR